MSQPFQESNQFNADTAFSVIVRSLRFVSPFRWQLGVKLGLLLHHVAGIQIVLKQNTATWEEPVWQLLLQLELPLYCLNI